VIGFFIMSYFLYIIQSDEDGTYYVGSTQDIEARLARHNQGRSNYTRNRGPWEVVYLEEYSRRADAVKREKAIKNRKRRDYIESLVRASRQA
jgi:putative endonuclease